MNDNPRSPGPKKRRCKARLSDKSRQCRLPPILGAEVCHKHGGGAPQVKRSARERLNALVEPAVEALHQALASGDVRAVIRAAQIVLDRCGYGPGAKIEVTDRGEQSPWLGWCTGDELAMILEIGERAQARMEEGEPARDDFPSQYRHRSGPRGVAK